MSGGSFDYASLVDNLTDFVNKSRQLHEIAEALYERGADDVAADLDGLLDYINGVDRRVQARLKRLTNVMMSLEWWQSGDYGQEQFEDALAIYRNRRESPPSPVVDQYRKEIEGRHD